MKKGWLLSKTEIKARVYTTVRGVVEADSQQPAIQTNPQETVKAAFELLENKQSRQFHFDLTSLCNPETHSSLDMHKHGSRYSPSDWL